MTIYKNNQKIHIHSREGIYTIVSINYNTNRVDITCNRWYEKPIRTTTTTDIKCLAGWPYNS